MKTFHRTPTHHHVLDMVRNNRVMWRAAVSPSEPGVSYRSDGFAHSNGGVLEIPVVVALWELKKADLITVDGGNVLLTKDGRDRLAEWTATQAAWMP